jgi:Ca2+-binding RTX toxin-like protein
MSGAAKWGSEILIGPSEFPSSSSIAGLADGRFLVTWDGSGGLVDGSSSAVHAQFFNADGSADGIGFIVNTTKNAAQFDPDVVVLTDGSVAIAWTDNSQSADDPAGYAVRAQVITADGAKAGPETLVNTATLDNQSEQAMAALSDGRVAVVWTDRSDSGADASVAAVRMQLLNADGTKSGGEVLVNTTTAGVQDQPSVTLLADDRFLVAWHDASGAAPDMALGAIRAQVFNADGTTSGGEFVMNTTTGGDQDHPAVAGLSDGRFMAAWSDGSGTGGDASGSGVRAQIFNADGSVAVAEFLVNTGTTGSQLDPAIAALDGGRFVVAWVDDSGNPADSNGAICAQVFNADGSKSGAQFLVNTTTLSYQQQPVITTLADGRFAISWTTNGIDSTAHVQVFDAREAAVNLAGTARDDAYFGTGFNDTMEGADGYDSLEGGGGNDRLLGDGDSDTLNGGDGDDRLDGGAEVDFLNGGDGNDTVIGADGNDDLSGGIGDDTIAGGEGNDDMAGGVGNDTYLVDFDNDFVIELANQGIDTVVVAFDYALGANLENLTLIGDASESATGNGLGNVIYGNAGNNLLDGLAGSDTMNGGSGADTMIAGAGKDLMTGGGGLDRMVFKALSDSGTVFATRDVINTFAHGDKVDLSALDANSKIAGNQAFTFVQNFSGAAGQLQWDQTAPTGYLVSGDVNGDGAADFSLQIYAAPGFGTIHGWDFIL